MKRNYRQNLMRIDEKTRSGKITSWDKIWWGRIVRFDLMSKDWKPRYGEKEW